MIILFFITIVISIRENIEVQTTHDQGNENRHNTMIYK